eukprot:g51690.t1
MTEVPVIAVDNAATVLGANNRIFTRRQRHLEVQMAYINEAMKEGRVRVVSTDDANNMADLNTKPVGKQPFERKRDQIRKGTFRTNFGNISVLAYPENHEVVLSGKRGKPLDGKSSKRPECLVYTVYVRRL